ncbi:MAG TPA: CPBP family intramembrane glutamic endopeptidase [Marinobacter sp.]|nr:CPBP family intramembrane glutamic endopeptidase [Marinobacter sp.]
MAGKTPPALSIAAALLFQGGIGVVGLIGVWLLAIPLKTAGLPVLQAIGWGMLGAGATYLTLLGFSSIPGLVPDDLKRQMQGLYRFARRYPGWVLVLLSVLAGVGEELLFRGAIQGGLERYTGPWLAIVIASMLFGLAHCISITYFLIATGLGVLLGVVYVISDSLALVMVWHAVYDMLALYCLLRYPHWFGLEPR